MDNPRDEKAGICGQHYLCVDDVPENGRFRYTNDTIIWENYPPKWMKILIFLANLGRNLAFFGNYGKVYSKL